MEIPKRFRFSGPPSSAPVPSASSAPDPVASYALAFLRVSGQEAGFLRELPLLQQNPSDSPLDVLTISDWQAFVVAVPVRRAIHVQLL